MCARDRDRMLEENQRRIAERKLDLTPPSAEDSWLYRSDRERAYAQIGPVAPVTYVPRYVIPPSGWKPPEDVATALAAISRDFALIEDPLTRQRWEPPDLGVHLYTIQKGRGPGGTDLLLLETSLTWEMNAQWKPGTARAPGMWLVDWVKAHDLGLYGASPEAVARRLNRERRERHEERTKARNKRDLFYAQVLFSEILDPYVRKNRVMLRSPVSCRLK